MSNVYSIADTYVERFAALDPISATGAGIPGHEHDLTDYSPAGAAARAELAARTIQELEAAPIESDGDRIASAVMQERLHNVVDQYELGERLRDLRVIGSPVGSIRACFDLMAYDTPDDRDIVRRRMLAVPGALTNFTASLREGMAGGIVAARRQALACADMAASWSGDAPFFRNLAAGMADDERLAEAAEAATDAYGELAVFLRDEYAPVADPHDPVGRDRYALGFTRVQRDRARLRRDLRVGMGGALPHRGRDAEGRRAHTSRRTDRGRDRTPRSRFDTIDHWCRRVPAMEPGSDRHDDRRARRHPLRHRGAVAPVRGDDRAARRRRGDVLHRPERGLLPAGPHVVSDARRNDVRALARGDDLLPRGGAGSSPPDRAGPVPRRHLVAVPAGLRFRVRPRRGVGPVRRTADG